MSSTPQRDARCAGQPPLCPWCQVALVADPTGPWCRTCRRAWSGAPRNSPCPNPAIATASTARTHGFRLCRIHARLIADRAGPDAITHDQPPR